MNKKLWAGIGGAVLVAGVIGTLAGTSPTTTPAGLATASAAPVATRTPAPAPSVSVVPSVAAPATPRPTRAANDYVQYVRDHTTTLGHMTDGEIILLAKDACKRLEAGSSYPVVLSIAAAGSDNPTFVTQDLPVLIGAGVVKYCDEYRIG
ncbi:hypothetical protein SEA_KINGBOB_36 [Arthrobacter phage KingBob]|uniref:DUF732 domain-containing protein n=1 Tax=Arthrobacter phage Sergei TaxID=2250416 RepID=A0A345KPX4_9CAUD|nr:hypothetical protein KDJ06_gp36 [Arthrobacter phage Sergei]ASZ74350.1 hypothetical protein TEMPER16_36 [Arthrobacter phage Temper16]AXH43963.1 hypothetical protein SEA_DAIBOJU_36 [Arthrobacter phage Daiboju]AXH44025.1 hypothetical protein SEA_HERB_36 [Arthrobacter phage Herb]AXH44269.1 hypothetical protein SEA_KINGBOB_36 [Arthrobacter phage KingBob]QGJ97176.1 hypothetical protein SEA_MARIA1952_35 [Arthrobacter phage Maria1952]